jgi:hypothetical protein
MRARHDAGDGRDRSREPLVKLAVAENPATGEFVKQVLADAGIRCLVKNTDALGVLAGALWTSPFSVQIFVLSGDESAAQAALVAAGFDRREMVALPPARRRRRRR